MKKFAIIFLIFIVAFFSLGYIQIEKIRSQLASSLIANNITFSQVEINLFPLPVVVVQRPQFLYKTDVITFEQAKFDVSISSLFFSKLGFKEALFSNGMSQFYDISKLNIKLSKMELFIDELLELVKKLKNDQIFDRTLKQKYFNLEVDFYRLENNEVVFSSDININADISFSNTVLTISSRDSSKKNTIKINRGTIHKNGLTYQLLVDKLWVNQGHFLDTKVIFQLPENKYTNYYLSMDSKNGYIKIDAFPQNNSVKSVNLSVFASLELSELLKVLQMPVVLSGNSQLKANVMLKDDEVVKGYYKLSAEKGAIYGLGLLSIVGQYVPINYDEKSLNSKNIDTDFNDLYLKGDYENKEFLFSQIILNTHDFVAEGQGKATLLNSECDIYLKLGLNNKKYSEYASLQLPVHFFGQCDNPQYKLTIDKKLLKQLKPLLLKKLAH